MARFEGRLGIYPWELESVLGELFIREKRALRPGPNRVLNCRKFSAMAVVINALRRAENDQAGTYLKRFCVLDELHRIAQRTFPWQAGYFNRVQFYRYLYIYGGDECARFFQQRNGLRIHELALVAFLLYVHFQKQPTFNGDLQLTNEFVQGSTFRAAVSLLSKPIGDLRRESREQLMRTTARWGVRPPIAFRPSLLRSFPLVCVSPNSYKAPLPELLSLRATAGLYYDLVPGGQGLLNECNARFESYCVALTNALVPKLDAVGEYRYRIGAREYRSCDMIVRQGGELALIVECKASKLTFDAQFAENPTLVAKTGYDQLVKGVVQLWRFQAHTRLGATRERCRGTRPLALLVTLDEWLLMSRELRKQIVASAETLAADDPCITSEDRCEVVFTSVKDYERTLIQANEFTLFEAIRHAGTESYVGWLLPDVHKKTTGLRLDKPYPFELRDVLPWWDTLGAPDHQSAA